MPSAHEQGYIDRSLRPRTCHATHSMLLRSSVVSNPGTGSPGPETGFSEMLQSAVVQYQNRAITSAQVIEELIKLAKEVREAERRGDELGLTEDELAFYDALETNDSAVAVLGDETLKRIAQELVETVKRNATIDWNLRESARAKMRVVVKRLLRKYGYPPDKQEHATQLVLTQAEVVCEEWAV